ncbi:MAG: SDR family oxidoreductase [Kiritimatiellia bacterium]
MKPVCLALGASGFLGREAVPELAKSFAVVPTCMRPRPDGMRLVDMRDHDALAALIDEVQPDAVVAMAAYREPDFCETNPGETRRLNTEPCRVLVERLPSSTRLLYVSTDYVFDGDHPPYAEDAARHPVSVYGQSKKEAEDIVLSRQGSLVVRVPLLMGWTDDAATSGFFSHLVKDVMSEGAVVLDDVLARYPVWTRDMGSAMRVLLERDASGAFHCSTTRRLTRYTAALEMAELLGRSAKHIQPSQEVIPRAARRPLDAQLRIDKWLALGQQPPTDFREVARIFVERFKIA